ncbi:hypothetical protein RhiirA5_440150 [Rhizophagus irregularis]|uniref:Uncharacterized protein n=1 Tax=Rhizophagus irregularis TaxID=588596 RepID=A0A2N0NH28_9GLOM|nr:hypothetical protein RhiirA5_440150 [Rhizophagus irregularis]
MTQNNVTQLDCPEFGQNQIQQMLIYNLSNAYGSYSASNSPISQISPMALRNNRRIFAPILAQSPYRLCEANAYQLQSSLGEQTLAAYQNYPQHVHQLRNSLSEQTFAAYQSYPQHVHQLRNSLSEQTFAAYQNYLQHVHQLQNSLSEQTFAAYQSYHPQHVHQLRNSLSEQTLAAYQNYLQHVHQLRNSLSEQTYQSYPQQSQQSPLIYHSYPQQLQTSTSGTYSIDQNGEPEVLLLSPQSNHTAMPVENLINSQKLQKNCKIKNIQFTTKIASNKKRDPNTFELILKDKKSIIPRTKKIMKFVHFNDYSAIGIRRSVEDVYPELKIEDWDFFKCESVKRKSADARGSHKLVAANDPQNVDEIKR